MAMSSAAVLLISGQEAHVGLDDILQPQPAGSDDGGVIVIRILPRRSHQGRNGDLEFAYRVRILACAHEAGGNRAPRYRGVEVFFAEPGDLAFEQRLGGCKTGFDLPGGVKRTDARAVEIEHLTPPRFPFGNPLVEFRVNRGRFFCLALQDQHAAERQLEIGSGMRVVRLCRPRD